MQDDGLLDAVDRLRDVLMRLGRIHSLRDPMAEISDLDLNPTQLHALMWLGNDGALPMSMLAQRTGSTLPACTRFVDRLKAEGFVVREGDPADRRVVLVRLTTKGQQLHERLEGKMREKLSGLLGLVSDPDRQQLIGILERLEGNMLARVAELSSPEVKAS